LLSFTCVICKAQYITSDSVKYKIVSLDTINVTGHVFDIMGRPVNGVLLISKNNKAPNQGYPLCTKTDLNGAFNLSGTLPVDTLQILYRDLKFDVVNNKSRYIDITLPETLPEMIGNGEITTKRIVPLKPAAQFKVATNITIMDYFGPAITVRARYSAGADKFVNYIKSKIVYPAAAVKNNIEGVVQVKFTVERDGSIVNPVIVRGIGYGCDEAVINALKDCPKWQPAVSMGLVIKDQCIIGIEFKLTDSLK
jgi:TonB family protein